MVRQFDAVNIERKTPAVASPSEESVSNWSQPAQTIRYRENGKAPPVFKRRARSQGIDRIPRRSCSFLITGYR